MHPYRPSSAALQSESLQRGTGVCCQLSLLQCRAVYFLLVCPRWAGEMGRLAAGAQLGGKASVTLTTHPLPLPFPFPAPLCRLLRGPTGGPQLSSHTSTPTAEGKGCSACDSHMIVT